MIRTCLTSILFLAGFAALSPGAEIPLLFMGNRGQAPAKVQFMVKGAGLDAYFLPGEVHLEVPGRSLRIRLEGASPGHALKGKGRLSGRANFLTGSPSGWAVDIPLYESLVYRQVYPGIDLVYGGEGRKLKSEVVVAPGADPGLVRMRYLGGGAPWVDSDGSLVVRVGDRELREEPPVVYQERDGAREPVVGRFVLLGNNVVGFGLGKYDRTRTLVIDPVLSYSTLLGGSGTDTASAVAVDASGAAYIAGYTDSTNLPAVNSAQSFNAGGNEVMVAKFSPGGNSLVYCTYLGGSADDRAYGIAVDGQGNAYIAGSTTSRNFPVRGALQATLTGYRNAFVAKLNPAGNGLVYSTYLGGNASDSANGIAVDSSGAAYVTGDTTSYSFPASGYQRGIHGGQDAFVAKLSADGSHLVYSTYLGGSGDDRGTAIALDGSGSAYITGSTFSIDFPVLFAAQQHGGGGQDAFVTRLSADGSFLWFSTYLGGSGGTVVSPEIGEAIAVDVQGNAYVAGVTSSADFPRLNALQTSLRGLSDAFVSKLTAAGALSYSTYLGGSGAETATGVAVDSSGNAYVSGYTYSTDLPVVSPVQAMNAGEYDAFVAELNSAGNALSYLSYLGGNGSDAASSIALDSSGTVYVAGWTLSTNFPLLNSYQLVNSGNYGMFVTKMIFSTTPVNVGVTPASGNGAGQVFSFQFADPAGATDLTSVGALFGVSAGTSGACAVSYDRVHNALFLLTDSGQAPAGSITPGSGTQQNSQCTLSGAGSTVALSGPTLTLNLALTFLPAFNGSKTVYMQAITPLASTAWQPKGAWSVTFAVTNVSVTPSAGSGATQLFSFQFSDEAGSNDLTSVSVLFNSSASTVTACSVTYDRARNALSLLTDAGQLPSASITPGSGTQQNQQCTLSGTGSSVVLSGRMLTLNLALTFLPAFSGTKNIYMQAISPFGSAP
uniref:Beta-propeller repeat protein n=1 Tax=Solibacter usitatus (strain Ellin6076) TaxID=234267 RepID=Q02BK6_SOLUE